MIKKRIPSLLCLFWRSVKDIFSLRFSQTYSRTTMIPKASGTRCFWMAQASDSNNYGDTHVAIISYCLHHSITYTHVLTGCYVSAENLMSRLAFSSRNNVYMKAMYIPEAYYNKTSLDGHFATAGKQMRASVVANKGDTDTFDAASMFKARISAKATGTVYNAFSHTHIT